MKVLCVFHAFIGALTILAFGIGVWQDAAECYGGGQPGDFVFGCVLGLALVAFAMAGLVAAIDGALDGRPK